MKYFLVTDWDWLWGHAIAIMLYIYYVYDWEPNHVWNRISVEIFNSLGTGWWRIDLSVYRVKDEGSYGLVPVRCQAVPKTIIVCFQTEIYKWISDEFELNYQNFHSQKKHLNFTSISFATCWTCGSVLNELTSMFVISYSSHDITSCKTNKLLHCMLWYIRILFSCFVS